MSDAQLLLFVVTSLVVILTPGQDMILVMSRSIAQGSAAGIVTATYPRSAIMAARWRKWAMSRLLGRDQCGRRCRGLRDVAVVGETAPHVVVRGWIGRVRHTSLLPGMPARLDSGAARHTCRTEIVEGQTLRLAGACAQ